MNSITDRFSANSKCHPLVRLPFAEFGDAHPFRAAPQFVGVLSGDRNTVRHHPDFDGHTRRKASLRKPFALQWNEVMSNAIVKLPDGRTVVVRERSTDGRPNLELQSGKNRIKFRYDE